MKTDSQPARDVLSPIAYRRGNVEVVHLDGLTDEDGDFIKEQARGAGLGLADATTRNPTRSMNSTLDLAAWLGSLDDTDLLRRRSSALY